MNTKPSFFSSLIKDFKPKDFILIGLITAVLLVAIFHRPATKVDNTKIEQLNEQIKLKLDSISKLEFKVEQKEVDISRLEKGVHSLYLKLNQIDEKLKKDTAAVNSYTDEQLDSFFRARYGY